MSKRAGPKKVERPGLSNEEVDEITSFRLIGYKWKMVELILMTLSMLLMIN